MFELTDFWPMFPFYTPLKTPENQRFSDVFSGCRMGTLAKNRLTLLWLVFKDFSEILTKFSTA